ncbi:cysteine desulfurase family protein [Megasphaera hominis]|jgi:cysteine desulfurase|uniref:cysteine desulfurase n=1 Tax=Megasphaera hominis TaxID=159836 RepID=A0ABR6VIL9_9FIRM|nr:cysteine desulfurase family protein [Megasphaera hominis]MBC3536572.1 cysteine desulfurase [Megasphaera hominis]
MERIYLDHAAATPIDRRVLDAMMPYLTTAFGNPSSLHYFGQEARAAVQRARQQVAHCLGVAAADIVFTSGGTEGDNLAIRGYLRANFPQGGHLITTAVEHQAVLHTFEAMARQGYSLTVLPVDAAGRVRIDDVAAAIRDDTVLISCMYANNETGTIQPIRAIGELAAAKGIAFHVDAVQAFGYVPIQPLAEHIDLLTLCSHKIYGPKGIGALYIRHGLQLTSEAYGGPQEHRLRAGTENVAAIVGFGEAVALLEAERPQRIAAAAQLKQRFYDGLIKGDARFRLNGTLEGSLPNIIDFSVDGMESPIVLIALDMQGIAVSAGSACEAGAVEPSHVLRAMGVDEKWLRSSIRVSFGTENTPDQIDTVVQALQQILDPVTKRR